MSKVNGNGTNGKQVRNTSGLIPKPWKPGQSGNPKGRPKGPSFTTGCLRKLHGTIVGKDKQGNPITEFDMLIATAIKKAIGGDEKWAKVILERIDPALTRHDVTTQAKPSDVHTLTDRLTLAIGDRLEMARGDASLERKP